MQVSDLERFVAKVEFTDTCWLWSGGVSSNGYSAFWYEGTTIGGHTFLQGRAPEGLEWDHLCRNRTCVYPEHLEAVTQTENNKRRRKTHCVKGHPYDSVLSSGRQACKTCHRHWTKEYMRRTA